MSLLAACYGQRSPAMNARLSRVEAAIGAPATGAGKRLLYSVESEAGKWSREIVVAGDAYAERRTRVDDGVTYAFGRDATGAWLRINDGEVLSAEGGPWDFEARTGAGLFGSGFVSPGPDDEAEYMGRSRFGWELAYRPAGGRTLTFQVDRVSDTPRGFDVVDDFGRLVRCDDLAWARAEPDPRGALGPLLASLDCSANDRFGEAGEVLHQRIHLESVEPMAGALPDWARPGPQRRTARAPARIASFPLPDAWNPTLPVTLGDGPPIELALDTGAFFTTITADAARALGVVPTGETRLHVAPPWLAHSHLWIGIVPRLAVGDAELIGERVLVAESPRFLRGQGVAGLLGESFLRRFVVDLDSPGHAIRLAAREAFRPDRGAATIRMRGSGGSHRIEGEVVGVDKGGLLLDTGAPVNMIVHSPEMKIKHPRRRGDDRALGGADSTQSPDYDSHVDGLRFGPFPLPDMDAIGRDRDRERVGPGIALVGMGVMRYFRLAFDLRDNQLWVWPGDAYHVLRRAGMDLEAGEIAGEGPLAVSGLPKIDRIVESGPARRAGLRQGDFILGIGSDVRTKPDLAKVRRALATSPDDHLLLWVSRRGIPRPVRITLDPPDCLPPDDFWCRQDDRPPPPPTKKKKKRR